MGDKQEHTTRVMKETPPPVDMSGFYAMLDRGTKVIAGPFEDRAEAEAVANEFGGENITVAYISAWMHSGW